MDFATRSTLLQCFVKNTVAEHALKQGYVNGYVKGRSLGVSAKAGHHALLLASHVSCQSDGWL